MRGQCRVRSLAAALALLSFSCASAAAEPEKRGDPTSRDAAEGARGWFWYDDPPSAPRKKEAAPVPVAIAPAQSAKPDFVRQFEAFQERVKESRMRFFIDPSPENARAMAEIQTAMVTRASDATDVWQRVIWANPQFDFTQDRPVNQVALAAREQARRESRIELFERLANTQVLYFIFRADCPYCNAFAPILAAFSRATGIRVFPVSLDGTALDEFPRPARDNGIAKTLNVTTVPALFLADPAKARIAPIGYGVMSETELAERIEAIANPPNPELRAATPVQTLRPMEATQ